MSDPDDLDLLDAAGGPVEGPEGDEAGGEAPETRGSRRPRRRRPWFFRRSGRDRPEEADLKAEGEAAPEPPDVPDAPEAEPLAEAEAGPEAESPAVAETETGEQASEPEPSHRRTRRRLFWASRPGRPQTAPEAPAGDGEPAEDAGAAEEAGQRVALPEPTGEAVPEEVPGTEEPEEVPPPSEEELEYRRRGQGVRTRRRRAMQRARRKRQAAIVLAATVVVAAASVVAGSLRTGRGPAGPPESQLKAAPQTQQTWLLIGSVESDTTGQADWLAVASWDFKSRRGFVMYVPRSTIAEIPGHGQDVLARSLSLGREPLMLLTMSNLLGIQFDHHVRISDQSTRALFDTVGGLTIEVERKLTRAGQDGRSQVAFAEGRQHMDGKRVAEYLGFTDETGDEISRSVRHAEVWSTLFEQFRPPDPANPLGKLFAQSRDLFATDASPDDLSTFFGAFASQPATQVQFETMPVRATGIETGAQLYAPEGEALEAMVRQNLSGSRPKGAGEAGRRIEILNGNGEPGIGQRVSDALIPKGFRVVLNQNAKSFNYDVTQIVVYSDSKDALQVAEEVRRTLGLGEVVISRQQQSIVDLTVVVGRDYLKARR